MFARTCARWWVASILLLVTPTLCTAQIIGACCTPNSDGSKKTCTVRTSGDCCAARGVYYGDRTSCTPEPYCARIDLPAPIPCGTGACCIDATSGTGAAVCDLRTFDACCEDHGHYYGDGAVCLPATCAGTPVVGCPTEIGPAELRSAGAFSKYLNPGRGGAPVSPGTAPGGDICGMGGIICAPNPFAKGQFKYSISEVRETGLGLGGGPIPPQFMVIASPLTPAGAFGLGERNGYPADPCPSAGPRAGTFWPFRDAVEVNPFGGACLNGDGFMSGVIGSSINLMLGGEARGGPADLTPGFPRGIDQLNRGMVDAQGLVRFGAFEIVATGGQQRLAKVKLNFGCVDQSAQNPTTGEWSLVRNIQILPRTDLVVLPGVTALVDGAAVNGLAAFLPGEYPPDPIAVQDTQTSAGDEDADDDRNARSKGSELDAMYAKIVTRNGRGEEIEPSLRLFLSGNLLGSLSDPSAGEPAANYANLAIFFDTIEGDGQHTLRGDNSSIAENALNRMGHKSAGNGNTTPGPNGAGLTFEPGCDPDFYTNVSLRTADNFDFDLLVHHASLPSGGGGQGWLVGSIDQSMFMSPGTGALTGGDVGAPAIAASISNANFNGVGPGTGLADPEAAEAVNTGVELLIPLSAIGNPSGKFRIVAFINARDHDLVSNQVLPGIGGGGPLGEPRLIDFGSIRNMQCATIYPSKNPLWKNGDFDRREAQMSMIGADQDWNLFARISADDFALCDGQIHAVRTITGTLTTDAAVPKAAIVIWEDCDGQPNLQRPIAVISSAPQVLAGRGLPVVDADVLLHDGGVFDGFNVVNVEAHLDKPVFLRGGVYWVSIIGFSGTGDPQEQFFWGTASEGVVKGRPGQFYDSDVGAWEDIDLLCCGCSDFSFCIGGESCKILFDNASPKLSHSGELAATPSLQNGTRTSDKSRSASDIVLLPCDPVDICYVEGYIWTNCERIGLEFYPNACDEPGMVVSKGGGSLFHLADGVIDTGERAFAPGSGTIELKLLKAVFYDFPSPRVPAGENLWVSLFALGDNAQNARGYLALGDRCDRACDRLFHPPRVRGPAFDTQPWRAASGDLSHCDHAIMVAVHDADRVTRLPTASIDCPADVNDSGDVTVQDIFDFLTSWFQGGP